MERSLAPLVASALVALSWSLPVTAAPRPPNQDVARLLQGLAANGQLSHADASRLTADALDRGEGPRVPIARSANGSVGCLNEAVRLTRAWAKTKGAELQSFPPSSVGHVDSQTLPLRVYYQTDGDKPTAAAALKAAEQAWQQQVVQVGYPQPFTGDLNTSEPLPGLWIYVADTGVEGGGYTDWLQDIPTTPISDCSSYVVIDDQNSGADIDTVVAHEFNHTTQMATDCVEAISAWENFTTAVEVHYFPNDWTFTYFVGSFQRYPEYPLDYWSDPYGGEDIAYYQYGAALFPIYLQERFGGGNVTTLRDFWYSFAQQGTLKCSHAGCFSDKPNNPNWFQGTDNVLKTRGSNFEEAFDEFSVWRAITGMHDDHQHFKHGSEYEGVAIAREHSLAMLPVNGEALDVYEYGSRYIRLTPDGQWGEVHFSVTVDPDAAWSASLLLGRFGLPVQRLPMSFTNGRADLNVPSFSGVSWAILVVSQHADSSHNPDDMEYGTARAFSYVIEKVMPEPAPEPLPEPVPEAGPDVKDAAVETLSPAAPVNDAPASDGGCGCSTTGSSRSPVALLALALLVFRRRVGGKRSRALGDVALEVARKGHLTFLHRQRKSVSS
jgi:MYXO-CTERM domain-containing protein